MKTTKLTLVITPLRDPARKKSDGKRNKSIPHRDIALLVGAMEEELWKRLQTRIDLVPAGITNGFTFECRVRSKVALLAFENCAADAVAMLMADLVDAAAAHEEPYRCMCEGHEVRIIVRAEGVTGPKVKFNPDTGEVDVYRTDCPELCRRLTNIITSLVRLRSAGFSAALVCDGARNELVAPSKEAIRKNLVPDAEPQKKPVRVLGYTPDRSEACMEDAGGKFFVEVRGPVCHVLAEAFYNRTPIEVVLTILRNANPLAPPCTRCTLVTAERWQGTLPLKAA